MKSSNNQIDYLVIGAGFSGLSFAALMANQGANVCVLEAHSLIGGCASYFKRKGFHFEAGATTLSGLAKGRPLERLCAILDLKPATTPLEIPMSVTLNNKKIIKRYRNHEQFVKELKNVFPNYDHEPIWENLRKWERALWSSLGASQNFPPKSAGDLLKLIKPKLLKEAYLGALAFQSFKSKLPREMQEDQNLMEFFDEQLMISTQSPAHDAPALLAAMGMTYPEDMHYINGGITSLAQLLRKSIEGNGSEVLTRHKVSTIEQTKNGFKLQVKKGKDQEVIIDAKAVISSVPIWNISSLFVDQKISKLFKVKKASQQKAWGAVIANFGIKYEVPVDILYHQIHFKNHKYLGTGSLFFSFSHQDDSKRAPIGHQAVTVSTHTKTEFWQAIHSEGRYEEVKLEILEFIIEEFTSHFGQTYDIIAPSLGTPHTYERYTGRKDGRVGGLAHNRDNNILTFPTQETALKNFYRIGDTTFPGQGIVGVTTGSLILAGKLSGKNFIDN